MTADDLEHGVDNEIVTIGLDHFYAMSMSIKYEEEERKENKMRRKCNERSKWILSNLYGEKVYVKGQFPCDKVEKIFLLLRKG